MEEPFSRGAVRRGVAASVCDALRPESLDNRRFPLQARLKRRKEVQAVFDSGTRAPGRFLALWVAPGTRGKQEARAVIVAGRRLGGAVARNRAKRLLREAFRLNRHRVECAYDLALVARADCVHATRSEVESELVALLARVGCLRADTDPDCATHGDEARS